MMGHVQQRDGRWCIVDLVGKHGRVRTVPMPTWVKKAIDITGIENVWHEINPSHLVLTN